MKDPILNAFEEGGKPILTPDKFYEKKQKIADIAVACFSRSALEYVLANYEHEVYFDFRSSANGPTQIYYLPKLGILFFMSMIGSAQAGGLLHEIAYITGATKYIYFGSCGVTDDSLQGQFLVPTACYREEGYSYHYAPSSEYMPIRNNGIVSSFLASTDLKFSAGKGWTTDAIYNETIQKWQARKEDGVLCVDMEASGLQAIADHIGAEVYIFFFAGDILGQSWESGNLGGENEKVQQCSAVEVALSLAQSLKH